MFLFLTFVLYCMMRSGDFLNDIDAMYNKFNNRKTNITWF